MGLELHLESLYAFCKLRRWWGSSCHDCSHCQLCIRWDFVRLRALSMLLYLFCSAVVFSMDIFMTELKHQMQEADGIFDCSCASPTVKLRRKHREDDRCSRWKHAVRLLLACWRTTGGFRMVMQQSAKWRRDSIRLKTACHMPAALHLNGNALSSFCG